MDGANANVEDAKNSVWGHTGIWVMLAHIKSLSYGYSIDNIGGNKMKVKLLVVAFLAVFGSIIIFAPKAEAYSYKSYTSSYRSYKVPSYSSYQVKGYSRSNGTYVKPYYRTYSNNYKWDNYSSRGNYNPYTGKKGYVKW